MEIRVYVLLFSTDSTCFYPRISACSKSQHSDDGLDDCTRRPDYETLIFIGKLVPLNC